MTFELTRVGPDTRLQVTHSELRAGSPMDEGIREGWPVVCSNLKTLLETGRVLSDEQWETIAKKVANSGAAPP